jgi:hypothetical protein
MHMDSIFPFLNEAFSFAWLMEYLQGQIMGGLAVVDPGNESAVQRETENL